LKEITLRASATIANFGPGFDIFALALDHPYDVITIRKNEANSIHIKVKGMEETIPTEVEKNTAGVAAIDFFKKSGISSGIDIEIKKGIKPGAGLGASGASAASCIYGLNKLFETGFGYEDIIQTARQGEVASGSVPHADNVAGCLFGGFILIKDYFPVKVIKINPPEIPIVICVQKKPISSTRNRIPGQFGLTEVTRQMSFCASLVHALMSGDIEKIGTAVNHDLVSEPVRSRSIPQYREIKAKVLEAGAYGCNVSGGGSSLFAICEKEKTEQIAEIFEGYSREKGFLGNVLITRSSRLGITEVK